MVQFQFRMICTYSPIPESAVGWEAEKGSSVAMDSDSGTLSLITTASGPPKDLVTTPAMREAKQFKWIESAELQSWASSVMDWNGVNFAHPNDSCVELQIVKATVSRHQATWSSPAYLDTAPSPPEPPAEYTSPVVNPGPDTLNRSESDGKLTVVGNWGSYGWMWSAVYDAPSTLVLSNANIGSWAPSGHGGKTAQISWTWMFDILQRSRKLCRERSEGSIWKIVPAAPPADGSAPDPNGWSEWQ